MDKRIIRTIPVEMHLANQAVLYDGMEDFITNDSFDHTAPGVLFASEKKPVFEDDGDGNKIKVSDETILIAVHPSIKKRHTFAGWKGRGEEVVIEK